ncbi:hypothetical protein HDU96_008546 [Phlyctochytrium bullatum]|nr:hypothetical protein HDU96_008546 [Phlyctochytrium bullatum]
MKELGIRGDKGEVAFAQLMGMQDGTSYGLASNGYACFKYIPYGPVEVTIPYLLRRAEENSSMLGGVSDDLKNLTREISTRLPFSLFRKSRGQAAISPAAKV